MQETLVQFQVRKIRWRKDRLPTPVFLDFPGGSAGKETTCNAGDLGSIPGLGRSPGEGKSYPISILAWRIPWTIQSMGSKRVGHDWVTFTFYLVQFSSVHFSRSIMSDSLRPHGSQHARPPCSSPSPGVHSDSHPSSPWCHPAISSSVISFSSCPQSLPASQSFPMSQLFTWGGQITGVSALASFLPKKFQGWSPSE